jgi:hypothetical protein
MDHARAFQRSFAAGAAALAIAMSGQALTGQAAAQPSCPLTTRVVVSRVSTHTGSTSLAQRVARALIGAVLNGIS